MQVESELDKGSTIFTIYLPVLLVDSTAVMDTAHGKPLHSVLADEFSHTSHRVPDMNSNASLPIEQDWIDSLSSLNSTTAEAIVEMPRQGFPEKEQTTVGSRAFISKSQEVRGDITHGGIATPLLPVDSPTTPTRSIPPTLTPSTASSCSSERPPKTSCSISLCKMCNEKSVPPPLVFEDSPGGLQQAVGENTVVLVVDDNAMNRKALAGC
jgi:hypothetical protein